jgi:hypothetical protein
MFGLGRPMNGRFASLILTIEAHESILQINKCQMRQRGLATMLLNFLTWLGH